MKKRILASIIVFLMIFSILPLPSYAEGILEDITTTGLNLYKNTPTEETVYKAGEGSITFIPASATESAKIILNNATIDSGNDKWDTSTKNSGLEGIVLKDNTKYNIELIGTNTFSRLYEAIGRNDGTSISDEEYPYVHVYGSGKMIVKSSKFGINSVNIDIDKTTLEGQEMQQALIMSKNGNISESNIKVVMGDNPKLEAIGTYGVLTIKNDSKISITTTNYGIKCESNSKAQIKIIDSEVEILSGADGLADLKGANPLMISNSKIIDNTTNGIRSLGAIKIEGTSNVSVMAKNLKGSAIRADSGNVEICDTSLVSSNGGVGIYTPKGKVILEGTPTVTSIGELFCASPIDITKYAEPGCKVDVGVNSSKEDASAWDGVTEIKNYKYLHIEPKPHEHIWQYSSSDNIIFVKCSNEYKSNECKYQNENILSLTLVADNMSYSGNAYDKASFNDGISDITGDIVSEISYIGRDKTEYTENTIAPTNAGKYTAKISIGGKTATADFEITKASIVPTVSLEGWSYGENANTPEVKGNIGNGEVTYTYYIDKDCTIKTSAINGALKEGEVPTNAGTYFVKATIDEADNYESKTVIVSFVISKKSITVTVDDKKITYGDAEPVYTSKVTTGELIKGDTLNLTYNREMGKDVNTYKITVGQKKEENPNYNITFESGVLTIVPKIVNITCGNTTLIYNEKKQSPVATTKDIKSGDDCNLKVTGEATKVGKYTAAVDLVGKDARNYRLSNDEIKIDFEIIKADPILTTAPTAKTLTYNGLEQKAIKAGKVVGGSIEYSLDNKNWSKKILTVKNAGKYTVFYKVVGDENHNSFGVKKLTVTVNKKAVTVTAKDTFKFIGKKDPKITYVTKGLVAKDKLTGITVSRKKGEAVGNYTITASQKKGSNPNYKITFKKGIFTIKQVDQSKLNGNKISELKLPILLAKGKGEDKSITLSWRKINEATGYECYWSYCDGKKNYKKFSTVKSAKLTTIHKKLDNSKKYKYFVVAYKMEQGRKIYIAKSNCLHVAMKDAKLTNVKSIAVNKASVSLATGKSFTIKATTKLENGKKQPVLHAAQYRYYTTNKKVATVSSTGKITAKAKGSCKVYVLANNGVYKTVKVTVK